jgi:hypothetical protein
MTLHDITYRPESNGLAGMNKGIYKYIQGICRTKERREPQFPKRGFSHRSLYEAWYLHKTSANEEKSFSTKGGNLQMFNFNVLWMINFLI